MVWPILEALVDLMLGHVISILWGPFTFPPRAHVVLMVVGKGGEAAAPILPKGSQDN